jgi:predicted amidohydrolase
MLDPVSGTARVALLQLPAYDVKDAAASLAHTLRRIDDVGSQRPDIIVLPEGTYPAYFLGGTALPAEAPSPAEALTRLGEKARTHGTYIAAGIAMEAEGAGYTNSAVLIDRSGAVAGRYDKTFLWHFDARWFAQGSAYPVFETDFGRVGMLICADGRLPEIARSLAVGGAQIILDLTAWVSGGRTPDDLTSVQVEYLMPVRAAENGVWVAAADKFGVEAGSIVYCGRSRVIDPTGRTVAELGPEEDAALVYDVPVEDARPPVERRPEEYRRLTQPTESLRVSEVLARQDKEGRVGRVAAVQADVPRDAAGFLTLVERHARRQALQDTDVLLFPAAPADAAYTSGDVLEAVRVLATETGVHIAFSAMDDAAGRLYRALHLVGPEGIVGSHRQTHGPGVDLADGASAVVETPAGGVGLLVAEEGFVPEVARTLMLDGAEVLLWSAAASGLATAQFARARADENRVYVAAAAPPGAAATMVADPAGRVLAMALEGRELAVGASLNTALSRWKEMAPGTDVVRNRQPQTYGVLTAKAAARPVV